MNEDAYKFLRNPWYWVKMTSRQREALRLSCRNLSQKRKAKTMGVDPRVVSYHLSAALKKINLSEGIKIKPENLVEHFIEELAYRMRG